MRTDKSISADYFERMFASNPDPWQFESSPYEAAKYIASINSLDGRRYSRALEVGCANGVFTQMLGGWCDTLIAIDVSDNALGQARERCSAQPHIAFFQKLFPHDAPSGQFDLIILSEVVYYWSDQDILLAAKYIQSTLQQTGELLMVHWTGDTDYPQTGDGAIAKLRQALPTLKVRTQQRTDRYRLDLWQNE